VGVRYRSAEHLRRRLILTRVGQRRLRRDGESSDLGVGTARHVVQVLPIPLVRAPVLQLPVPVGRRECAEWLVELEASGVVRRALAVWIVLRLAHHARAGVVAEEVPGVEEGGHLLHVVNARQHVHLTRNRGYTVRRCLVKLTRKVNDEVSRNDLLRVDCGGGDTGRQGEE
jgi:hypothetical protein